MLIYGVFRIVPAFDRPVEPLMLMVMLGLVPLVNIPFDWASVGLTRWLLRRGCAAGGRPFLLGLVDMVCGAALVVPLAGALIAALQVADWAIARSAGRGLVHVLVRIQRIGDDAGAAENIWIYVTLFSTLVPSLLNAVLGTFSLVTWTPPLRRWMVSTIADPGASVGEQRAVEVVLGVQVFLAVTLPCLAMVGLWRVGWWLVPGALPWFLRGATWWAETVWGWFPG